MSRWIDADELGASVIKNTVFDKGDVIKLIEDAPSIDIVRCEECKHKEKCTMAAHHLTVGKGIKFVPITYCSAGERQTERSE